MLVGCKPKSYLSWEAILLNAHHKDRRGDPLIVTMPETIKSVGLWKWYDHSLLTFGNLIHAFSLNSPNLQLFSRGRITSFVLSETTRIHVVCYLL